jgi:hypothetical protein
MRALGWILIAVGPLVVVAFPMADARWRSPSAVAPTMAGAGIRSAGLERRP